MIATNESWLFSLELVTYLGAYNLRQTLNGMRTYLAKGIKSFIFPEYFSIFVILICNTAVIHIIYHVQLYLACKKIYSLPI